MTSDAQILREFAELLDELDFEPIGPINRPVKPDNPMRGVPQSRKGEKKSNIIPSTAEGRLREYIKEQMDRLMIKIEDDKIDPEIRESLENKIKEFVAFAERNLQ